MTQVPATPERIASGGLLNLAILTVPLFWLSAQFMGVAERVLGEPVAWPQITFMSAYPSDVRNGYLLFVLAVVVVTLISSGLIGSLIGASPGKWLMGIRYQRADGAPAGRAMYARAARFILILAPVLLGGPVLGFVLGPIADNASLLVLFLSAWLFSWLAFAWSGRSLSWVNRTVGLSPTMKKKGP